MDSYTLRNKLLSDHINDDTSLNLITSELEIYKKKINNEWKSIIFQLHQLGPVNRLEDDYRIQGNYNDEYHWQPIFGYIENYKPHPNLFTGGNIFSNDDERRKNLINLGQYSGTRFFNGDEEKGDINVIGEYDPNKLNVIPNFYWTVHEAEEFFEQYSFNQLFNFYPFPGLDPLFIKTDDDADVQNERDNVIDDYDDLVTLDSTIIYNANSGYEVYKYIEEQLYIRYQDIANELDIPLVDILKNNNPDAFYLDKDANRNVYVEDPYYDSDDELEDMFEVYNELNGALKEVREKLVQARDSYIEKAYNNYFNSFNDKPQTNDKGGDGTAIYNLDDVSIDDNQYGSKKSLIEALTYAVQKFSPNAFLEDESKCKVLNSYIDVGTTHASLDWFNFNRVYQFIDEIEEQQDKLNEYLREHNEIYRMIVYYNIKKASIVKSNQYYESFDKNLLYYYRNEISRILPIIDSKKEEVAPHRDILYERYPHYADAEIDRFKRYIMSYLNNNETDTIDLTSNNKIEFRSPVYYEPKSFNVRDDYENNRNQHSSIKSVYYYGNLTTRGSGRVPNSGDVDYYYEGKYRNNATSLGLSDNDNYYKYKNWINYSFDLSTSDNSVDISGVEKYIKTAYLYRDLNAKYYELITKYIFYLTNVNEVQNDIWDSFIPKIGSVSEYNTNILAYIKNDVNGNNYTEYRDLIKEINDLNDDYEQSKSQLGGSFSTFTISDADIKTPEKYIMKNIIDNYGRIEGLPVEKIVKQTVEDDVHNYHLVLYENHEYRTLLKQWIDLSYSGDIDVGNSTLNEYLNELEKEQDRLRSEYGKTWVVIVEQNGNVVEDSTGKKYIKDKEVIM